VDHDRGRVLGSPFFIGAARWGIVSWAAIGVLVLGFFLFRYVVYPVRIIFPPLVVAMIGVYLLNPVVSFLEGRGISRIWGTLFTYLVGLAVVGTALAFTVPVVADQVQAFARSAPDLIDRASRSVQSFLEGLGLQVAGAAGGGESVVDFFGRLLSFTRGVLDLALILILGPILAFYLLVDLPKMKRALRAMIPARRRPEADTLFLKIGKAVGGFVRGQLLVALFVGVASAVGLFIVGLPFWAVVGLVVGLFNLIPLIGPFIGGFVAVLIAFTTPTGGEGLIDLAPGWPLAVGSVVALLIVQQIDNHIMSPNIVARTVNLHPVTVMLGLLAGGTLLGLWGMLLAVPVLATVKVLLLHAWDTRMRWPPPSSGEHPVVRPAPREIRPAETRSPGVEVQRRARAAHEAKEPARPTEQRGSWWHNAFRAVFGARRPRSEADEEAEAVGNEARQPERTSPGS
jgi:predicted PurR-regulated permease PerM